MIGILSLLITLTLSLLVTRVASAALTLTGISRESAKFQARSAFTGVGFTTSESEAIVNHPVRRRIVMLLMLFGNIGIAAVVAALMISFLSTFESDQEDLLFQISLLALGLVLLTIASSSQWVDRRLHRVITWALRKWTALDARDYVSLLELAKGHAVTEMNVQPGDWLAERTLSDLRLPDEGILVLGIRRADGTYRASPAGSDTVKETDTLLLYGAIDRIKELDERRADRTGEKAHREAVKAQDAFEELEQHEIDEPT